MGRSDSCLATLTRTIERESINVVDQSANDRLRITTGSKTAGR